MRSFRTVAAATLLAALILSSCDGVDALDESDAVVQAHRDGGPSADSSCTLIGGYKICLINSTPVGGSTTFVYKVSPYHAKADLKKLIIGFETCDVPLEVTETDPYGQVISDDATDSRGVLFKKVQKKNQSRYYSITFAGEIASGPVPVELTAGSSTFEGQVQGAVCEPPRYDLSGSVYIESDDTGSGSYGTQEPSEAGMNAVTVHLLNEDGSAALSESGQPYMALTDANGAFLFEQVLAGTYVIVVPSATSATDDDNETLYLSEGGSPLYRFAHPNGTASPAGWTVPVVLQSDLQIDLGFAPDAEAIEQALQGSLSTRNELPFKNFLPLIAGLSEPDEIAYGSVPLYQVTFGAYAMAFLGRKYDRAQDQTTYTYTVRRVQKKGHDVSHVTFGASSCMPALTAPKKTERGKDPTTGVSGVKFDFDVKREQTYSLTFNGDVEPGVIDVGIKYGPAVSIIQMPGACTDGIGSAAELLESLARIFSDGSSNDEFLFLPDPLVRPSNMSDLAAAITLLLDRDVEENSLQYLNQYLLAAQIIFDRGLGTPNRSFDVSLFQFVEPIILFESQNSSGKTRGPTAGTGGRRAGGSVLGGYISS